MSRSNPLFPRPVLIALGAWLLLCAGCAGYKPFPPGYLKANHQATVIVMCMRFDVGPVGRA